jgi:hypothetical protein
MKLSSIVEGLMSQSIDAALKVDGLNGIGQRSVLHNPELNAGADMGSRVLGGTSYPTGVPTSARHRKFLGFNRPYRIGV